MTIARFCLSALSLGLVVSCVPATQSETEITAHSTSDREYYEGGFTHEIWVVNDMIDLPIERKTQREVNSFCGLPQETPMAETRITYRSSLLNGYIYDFACPRT